VPLAMRRGRLAKMIFRGRYKPQIQEIKQTKAAELIRRGGGEPYFTLAAVCANRVLRDFFVDRDRRSIDFCRLV